MIRVAAIAAKRCFGSYLKMFWKRSTASSNIPCL